MAGLFDKIGAFLNFEEEEGLDGGEQEIIEEVPVETPKKKASDKGKIKEEPKKTKLTVKIQTPSCLSDFVEMAKFAKEGCIVIANTEKLNDAEIVRFCDYFEGISFALNGSFARVSSTSLVFCPSSVTVETITDNAVQAD